MQNLGLVGSITGGFIVTSYKCNNLGSRFPDGIGRGDAFLSTEFYTLRT